MIKNTYIIALTLLIGLFISCSNDRLDGLGSGDQRAKLSLFATNEGATEKESRVTFDPQNPFTTTSKLNVSWASGDKLRLFLVDENGAPKGNAVADFVISDKSLGLEQGAKVEFEYKGTVANDFIDGGEYTAIILGKSNKNTIPTQNLMNIPRSL